MTLKQWSGLSSRASTTAGHGHNGALEGATMHFCHNTPDRHYRGPLPLRLVLFFAFSNHFKRDLNLSPSTDVALIAAKHTTCTKFRYTTITVVPYLNCFIFHAYSDSLPLVTL